MRAEDALHTLLLTGALVVSVALASKTASGTEARVEQIAPRSAPMALVSLPGGARGIRDASGVVAKLARYRRIASTSLVADQILDELCEPERVIAVSTLSKNSERVAHRHRGRTGLASEAQLETILALRPDLLIVNHFGDPRFTQRLRAHGIVVFDLGEMHGVATLLPSIRMIGHLIDAAERAERLEETFARRLRAVAGRTPVEGRKRALYLSRYGKQIYGGARGTSYHDVIVHAGLDDAAAHYEGWPALDAERVIALDPDVLVTKLGMGRELCQAPGLDALRACRGRAQLVEIEGELIDDPGLAMLEATEILHAAVSRR